MAPTVHTWFYLWCMFHCWVTIQASMNRLNGWIFVNDFTGTCAQSTLHKMEPSPSPDLIDSCSPWRESACCTAEMSHKIHDFNAAYKFNMSHCGRLSPACNLFFLRDSCIYECSPDLGPWLVKISGSKSRSERVFKAPLCQSSCKAWFEACRTDRTCAANWAVGFVWKNGKNVCPPRSQCTTFQEVFGTANQFCETVWDSSWRVVPDAGASCIPLLPETLNPNRQVAPMRELAHAEAIKILGGGAVSSTHFTLLPCFLLFVSQLINAILL